MSRSQFRFSFLKTEFQPFFGLNSNFLPCKIKFEPTFFNKCSDFQKVAAIGDFFGLFIGEKKFSHRFEPIISCLSDEKVLACQEYGKGAMARIEDIVKTIDKYN